VRASSTGSAQDAWRQSVYWALLNHSKGDAAERFEKCGKEIKLLCMGCGFSRKVAQYCELRVCPECATRQSKKIQHRVMKLLRDLSLPRGWRARLITLTVKTDGHYEEAIERIGKALGNLWRSYLWRDQAGRRRRDARKRQAGEKGASGAVAGIEFGPKNGNVHVHLVYVGPYLPHAEFSHVWRRLVGEGYVWISAVRSLKAAMREALKYMSNVRKLSGPMVVELYSHLDGKRRIRSYGILRDAEEAAKGKSLVCEHCGGGEWMTEEGLAWMLLHPKRQRRRDPCAGFGEKRNEPDE